MGLNLKMNVDIYILFLFEYFDHFWKQIFHAFLEYLQFQVHFFKDSVLFIFLSFPELSSITMNL